MTQDEFNGLNVGDIVRGKFNETPYVVTAHYGDRVTAVRSADLTMPDEWDLVQRNLSNDNTPAYMRAGLSYRLRMAIRALKDMK